MAFLIVTGQLNKSSNTTVGTCVAVEAWADDTHKMRALYSYDRIDDNWVPTTCEWYGLMLTTANISGNDASGIIYVTDLDTGVKYKCNAIDLTDANVLDTVELTAV